MKLNLGLIPGGALVLPFFSGTRADAGLQGDYCVGASLAYYAALGICLGVYRNRMIVNERGPRYRLRLERES